MKAFIFSVLFLCLSVPAQATHIGEDALTAEIDAATAQLMLELQKHEIAAADRRLRHYDRMMKLAATRQARMVHRLESNPRAVLSNSMPETLRAKFPEKIRELIEQNVKLSGALTSMIADDFRRKVSTQSFHLKSTNGDNLDVRLAEAKIADGLAPMINARVSVKGLIVGRKDLVISSKNDVYMAADGTSTGTGTAAPTVAATAVIQGDQKTLVIMANFTDLPLLGITPPDLKALLFGSAGATMNVAYQQSSGGRVSFSGDVVGPFNINFSSTGTCDYFGYATALDAAALAAGFNMSNYMRVSYALPNIPGCGWVGLAIIGGQSPTKSWVKICDGNCSQDPAYFSTRDTAAVFTHELGHNLNFNHAATPTSNYGDESDFMGGTPPRLSQNNAPFKVMAGWYNDGQVVDVTSSGNFQVTALEYTSANSPLVLRLPKADSNEFYYISLRQAVGLDTGLLSKYLNTISVHRATGTLPTKTYLLANLSVNQSFNDPINGITITAQSLLGSAANVGVAIGAPTCTRRNPIINVTPSAQSGVPGATLDYTVNITNTDDAGCPSDNMKIDVKPSIQGAGCCSGSALTPALAPGASSTSIVKVTSIASQSPGDFPLIFTATHSSSTAYFSTATATYTVLGCARTTPTLTLSPVNQSGAPGAALSYNLSVRNNDNADCGSSIFNLNLPLPAGWSGGLLNSPLSIEPLSSLQVPLVITSPSTALGMVSSFTATATNSINSSFNGSASGTYTVVVAPPGDTVKPSAPTLSGTYNSRKNQITLTWTQSTDNVAVTTYRLYRDGIKIMDSISLSYVDSAVVLGSGYTYQVRALDAAGNEGLSNVILVEAKKATGRVK